MEGLHKRGVEGWRLLFVCFLPIPHESLQSGFYRKKCFTGKSDVLLTQPFVFETMGMRHNSSGGCLNYLPSRSKCSWQTNGAGDLPDGGEQCGGNWDNCNGTTIKYLIKNTLIWLVFRVLPFTLELCPELENCLVQKESVSISLNKWTSLLVLGFLRDAGSSPVCRHVWALST